MGARSLAGRAGRVGARQRNAPQRDRSDATSARLRRVRAQPDSAGGSRLGSSPLDHAGGVVTRAGRLSRLRPPLFSLIRSDSLSTATRVPTAPTWPFKEPMWPKHACFRSAEWRQAS